VSGDYVIDGQVAAVLSAVLAGVRVTAKNLFLRQPDPWIRAFDHIAQAYDRWPGIILAMRVTAKNLFLRQPDPWIRAFDHIAQAYDRWPGIILANCSYIAATVQEHLRFAGHV
jgi:DNA-directed RNA polymerase subunit H (RpoH/RPB5)